MVSRRWEPIGVAVAGTTVLLGLIVWLDNVHIATLNGMYKSIQLEAWIHTPANARLDPSNYIYFPVYGALCRFLDWIGVFRDLASKQIAVLNAGAAGLALAAIYVLVRDLTGRRDAALLACLLHLGSGFFLLLAVINEDIMPGYALVLWAMVLAAMRFDRPGPVAVIAVGILFTLGWLFEWRLVFPTLPALLAALALADIAPKQRLAMAALLLVTMLAVAGLTALCWDGHTGAMGLPEIIWTGKGVASAWAGFSSGKLELLALGVGQYLIGARNVPVPTDDLTIRLETWIAIGLQASAMLYAIVTLWQRWGDRRIRATLAVFLGTFFAGEFMNAYSQPQDPQMQINVMGWLPVVWGLALANSLLPDRRNIGRLLALLVLSALPLAYNVRQLSKERGGDTATQTIVAGIDDRIDLSRTVFLYWGFEPITGWQYFYDGRRWDGLAGLGTAPDPRRQVKWITVMRNLLAHPGQSGAENAAALKRDIDWALDNGYHVVAGQFWEWSAEQLGRSLVSVSGQASGPAIHAMLHDDFTAKQLFNQPGAGSYYLLSRAAPRRGH
jgi:hypothetical protein